MAVNINLHKKIPLPGQKHLPEGGFQPGTRFGFYGMVTEVHPESNTVNIRMDTGREISGLRVASLEWVTIDDNKGFLSGQRRLPPVDTFVFCITPDGDPARALVLCSAFGFQVAEHAAFKEDSEDAAHTKKRVTNSGWVFTEDNRTGTMIAQNKPEDPTIKIEVDQENEGKEKTTITIHGNIFTVDKDNGIKIETDKDIKNECKGGLLAKAEKKLNVESGDDMSIKSAGKLDAVADGAIKIKNSKTEKLELGNAIATMGAMISDFLQAAVSFKSLGSPASHTAPDFSATAGQIKAKWDQVFK